MRRPEVSLHTALVLKVKCDRLSLREDHMTSHIPHVTENAQQARWSGTVFLFSPNSGQKRSQPLNQADKSCKVLCEIILIQKCAEIF